MPIEEDINAFVVWATKLGFPQEEMPNDDALKSIFKSRQQDLFRNLMEKVQPRQDVKEVRENILIKKMEKLKDQVIPACSRSFLPKEMQRYLKIKELKSRKADIESQITDRKAEYDSLSSTIKTKNMQCIKTRQKHESLKAKVNMFEAKKRELEEHLEKERKNKELITLTTPVRLRPTNASESVAAAAIDEALKELATFYNLYLNNTNPHHLQEAKDELWKKIRNIFANIPNFLLYNAIVRLKEDQLQNIVGFNKTSVQESHHSMKISVGSQDRHSTFHIKLMESKTMVLGLAANYLAARKESQLLNKRFSAAYNRFVEEVQLKVNLFNPDSIEDVDEIISDYIVQYNTRSFNMGQNDYLSQQIDMCKVQIEADSRFLEDHEILLGSIKQVYAEISASINRIQYEKMQLNHIKDKILFSMNMMQRMLEDLQTSNSMSSKSHIFPTMNRMGNMSSVGESFEIGDNVFSSTKLDMDSTMSSLNNTAIRRNGSGGGIDMMLNPAVTRSTLPPYLTEISTFNETPIEKFSCVSKESAFYLSPNPLIIDSHELSSTIQLTPGILLTPSGALQEVRNRIQWAEAIRDISNELKIELDLVTVDPLSFKDKIKEQREKLAELLDKIDVADINTNRSLQKGSKYYKFILENPLRCYIPPTKFFNNQTYWDYESEYQMYYRMATIGNN